MELPTATNGSYYNLVGHYHDCSVPGVAGTLFNSSVDCDLSDRDLLKVTEMALMMFDTSTSRSGDSFSTSEPLSLPLNFIKDTYLNR